MKELDQEGFKIVNNEKGLFKIKDFFLFLKQYLKL